MTVLHLCGKKHKKAPYLYNLQMGGCFVSVRIISLIWWLFSKYQPKPGILVQGLYGRRWLIPMLCDQNTNWTNNTAAEKCDAHLILFVCLHSKIKWHLMLPNLGIIKLRRNPPPNLKGPRYTLNITAIDDNASGGPTPLSSFAEVIVGVNDINNNKPVFREVRCLSADILFPSVIGVIDSSWLPVIAGGLKGLCCRARQICKRTCRQLASYLQIKVFIFFSFLSLRAWFLLWV